MAGWAGQPSSTPSESEVVRQREQQRVKYLVTGDIDRLDQMTSPTLSYSHSNGTIDGKAKYIADLRARNVVFRSVNHRDVNVRLVGSDAAILNGISDFELTAGGQEQKIPLRFTIVYVKKNGEWLFEAWHSSRRAE